MVLLKNTNLLKLMTQKIQMIPMKEKQMLVNCGTLSFSYTPPISFLQLIYIFLYILIVILT